MYNEVIKLISTSKTQGNYGELIETTSEKQVFAELKSIGQSEFYQAQAIGLRPEIKFVIPDFLEYSNEERIKYQAFNEKEEQEYTVIRTYRQGNTLEIVCKRGVD